MSEHTIRINKLVEDIRLAGQLQGLSLGSELAGIWQVYAQRVNRIMTCEERYTERTSKVLEDLSEAGRILFE